MYVAIEGVDKTGKTTLWQTISIEFGITGKDLLFERIREPSYFFTLPSFCKGSPKEKEIQALSFAKDRLRNYELAIQAKKGPLFLLSDRSKFSSFAYQGEDVYPYNMMINKHMPDPDIVIYLYADWDLIEPLFDKDDIFEEKSLLEKAHEMYLGPIRQYCLRNNIEFVTFDSRDEEVFPQNVLDYLNEKLEVKE